MVSRSVGNGASVYPRGAPTGETVMTTDAKTAMTAGVGDGPTVPGQIDFSAAGHAPQNRMAAVAKTSVTTATRRGASDAVTPPLLPAPWMQGRFST